MLNTSGWAFSISSNKITEYGFLRTFSRELTALLMSDVSRRGADQLGYTVLLHVLRHIDADHRLLVSKDCLRQRLWKVLSFRLRSVLKTGRNRSVVLGSFNPTRPRRTAFATALHCLLLTDHALVQGRLLTSLKRAASPSARLLHRNLRPAGDNICHCPLPLR